MNEINSHYRKELSTSGFRLPAAHFSRGITVILVLGFMGVFSVLLSAVVGYALQQSKYGRTLYTREQALHIAEAGLEYYRWYLAHNPAVLVAGAGLETPYSYIVSDPEGGAMGQAQITATPSMQCGAVQWIDLQSDAYAYANPGYERTLSVRYMRPSVAEYSYLLNGNVWAGADRVIRGPYHSNGGIRMDATHNSDVTSSMATWTCDAGSGCPSTKPGVFGAGSNPALWTYPASSISFSAIGVNFTDLRTKAQTQGGIYYAQAAGNDPDERGYHLIFNAAGTVTIYRVTSTNEEESSSSQYGDTIEASIIVSQTLLGTYNVPSSCSLMFFEDRVWIEGTVNGKVTVVAATPSSTQTSPDAYLNNNIYYNAYDGTDGLTVIAERNVLIPLIVPNTMEIHGVFIASSGHYGRDYFTTNNLPSQYDPYVKRSTLSTVGTVVSNGRTGTSWICGGSYCSGFQTRFDYYDQILAFSPPPFTPAASTDYRFVLWREQ